MRLSLGALDLSAGQEYPLDGSEIPFPSIDALVALLPGYAQGEPTGRMRDALLAVIGKLANKVWADTGLELNALISPRFTTDAAMLDEWGRWRQLPRAEGETLPEYRVRLLTLEAGITPAAIRRAVLAVAAPFGAPVAIQEPAIDGMFFTPDDPTDSPWCCFWQPDQAPLWNYDPTMPNPTSGGRFMPDVWNGGAWIILQQGAGSDELSPHWTDDAALLAVDPVDFFADDLGDWGYLAFDGDPLELRIIAAVEARRAFGVSWELIEDPYLNGAS